MTPMLSFTQVKSKKTVVNKTVKQKTTNVTEKEVEQFTQPKAIKIRDSYLERYGEDNGFLFNSTSEKYVIIDADGYTQKELYNKMLLALNNNYIDIDKVVAKIEYDALTVNAAFIPDLSKKSVYNPHIFINSRYYRFTSIDYRLSFKFKEGKVRVDIPYIKCGKAENDIYNQKIYVEHSDLTDITYSNLSKDFDNLIVKLLKDAYQSKDNEW